MTEPATSFRDPAGFCFLLNGRVLRRVGNGDVADLESFLRSRSASEWVSRRQLVSTRRLPASEVVSLRESSGRAELAVVGTQDAVFEHERVRFANYPHEWPPELLWEAGRLTLEFAEGALAEGYGLKDATPYNVMFRGKDPVFIDVLSFERRAPGDPIWTPYAQFVRTFLLPLLANQCWGMRLADVFGTRRDGLEPEEAYRLCGYWRRFTPRMLGLVSLPTWLSRRSRPDELALYRPRRLADPEKAGFIVSSTLRRLRRSLASVQPSVHKQSVWSDYLTTNTYSEAGFSAKEQFVRAALTEFKPARVLDVGANTGHFSALAARAGAEVVAIDADPACAGAVWRRVREQNLNLLPLVVDLARPTPALGWRNRESRSFLDRAGGAFDGVLLLAVLHHLLVMERIPLAEILGLTAELTTSLCLVEFVPPQDAMFRRLARGREQLHAGLDEAGFEKACGVHFNIVKSAPLPDSQRRMYCLIRKGSRR